MTSVFTLSASVDASSLALSAADMTPSLAPVARFGVMVTVPSELLVMVRASEAPPAEETPTTSLCQAAPS